MSHTLTELDEFTATITVPDGTDSRNDAAGDVERIAQGLANRTKNLNAHGARTDVANVFNQGQRFDIANAAVAMIQRVTEATAGNVWRNELEYKINNSLYVRMYSGNGVPGTGGGMWIITTNARWQPGAGEQMWAKDDPARESNALRCIDGELHWYGKAAGGASWGPTGWDTGRGHMKVGDHVIAAGFDYPAPLPVRVKSLSLLTAFGNGVLYDNTTGFLSYKTGIDYAPLIIPIQLPAGAILDKVEFIVDQSTGNQFTGYSVEYAPNYVTLGLTRNVINSGNATTSGAGLKLATISFSNRTIVSGNRYEVVLGPGAAGADTVRDARVYFADPGPRNH